MRWPTPEDLDALGDVAAEGVHDPSYMPFLTPWTDAEPAARARATVQWQWKSWGEWKPEDWKCNFVVVADGRVVGVQDVFARDFAVTREVATGSWLGLKHQGQGIGTEMRAAVLHFAFAGLGAQWATSGAFEDNAASLAVSHKLGYEPDGVAVVARRGQPVTERRLRLSRTAWEAQATIPVKIEGLEPCLPLFGPA